MAGFFWFSYFNKSNKSLNNKNNTADFKLETKELSKTEALPGFPKDFPIEAGSTILQNYQATTSDGRIQSTKKFTTKLSTVEALDKYTRFFENLEWLNTGNGKQSPVLLKKKNDTLTILATQSSTDKSITELEVILVQNKK